MYEKKIWKIFNPLQIWNPGFVGVLVQIRLNNNYSVSILVLDLHRKN